MLLMANLTTEIMTLVVKHTSNVFTFWFSRHPVARQVASVACRLCFAPMYCHSSRSHPYFKRQFLFPNQAGGPCESSICSLSSAGVSKLSKTLCVNEPCGNHTKSILRILLALFPKLQLKFRIKSIRVKKPLKQGAPLSVSAFYVEMVSFAKSPAR